MKSNYIIRLITWEGEETQIPFRGSPRQADRVFIALAYALCESLYKYVFLAVLYLQVKKNVLVQVHEQTNCIMGYCDTIESIHLVLPQSF